MVNRPDEPILLENNLNSVSFKTGIENRNRKPPLKGSKVFFFYGWEGLLGNESADIGLPATAESAGASDRYYTQDQDGRHTREAIFCALLCSENK